MAILGTAVALVGVLCLLNLLFTVGVVRRLREQTEELAQLRQQSGPGDLILPAGKRVEDFATATAVGAPVTADDLIQPTLVGFFSPTCGPCEERMPQFIEYAKTFAGGRDRVLAVMLDEQGGADKAATLSRSPGWFSKPTAVR